MSREARLYSEVERLRRRLSALEAGVARIASEIRHGLSDVPRALLCRDLLAHAETAKRLAETLESHLEAQEALLRDRLARLAARLGSVDERLSKALAGVLAVLVDLVDRVRRLKSSASFEGLVEEARREALEAIRARRREAEEKVEELREAVGSVRRALEAAADTLSRYSVEPPGADPALYYIVVAEVEIGDARHRAVFDGGVGFDPGLRIDSVDKELYSKVMLIVRGAGIIMLKLSVPLFGRLLARLYNWFVANRVEAG